MRIKNIKVFQNQFNSFIDQINKYKITTKNIYKINKEGYAMSLIKIR